MIVCFYPFKDAYDLKDLKNSIFLDPRSFELRDIKIDNWELYYENVAVSLSKQKKIVEIPFNENLIKSFVQRREANKDFKLTIVVPSPTLKNEFISFVENSKALSKNINLSNRIRNYFEQDIKTLKEYENRVDKLEEVDYLKK